MLNSYNKYINIKCRYLDSENYLHMCCESTDQFPSHFFFRYSRFRIFCFDMLKKGSTFDNDVRAYTALTIALILKAFILSLFPRSYKNCAIKNACLCANID